MNQKETNAREVAVLKLMRVTALLSIAASTFSARADMKVGIGKPQVTGNKCIVKLEMKNGFAERIQSAKASLVLLSADGKALGEVSRWVIGGPQKTGPLQPGSTNHFNFVVPLSTAANQNEIRPKLTFSRIVLGTGKIADPIRSVTVESGVK